KDTGDERSGSEGRARALEGRERGPEVARPPGHLDEGEREGRSLHLWDGALPDHPLQGAVVQAPRHGRRDPRVHERERFQAEGQAIAPGGAEANMAIWETDPHSGGVRIPEVLQQDTTRRLLAHARKKYAGKFLRLEVRYRAQYCYVDAYKEPGP